jgi:purine nucleosidase
MSDTKIPLLIDVDTGIDDALGLLYACASSEADLLGVTTVAGNVDLMLATRNTRAVLALAGRATLPVWAGCGRPLQRSRQDASHIHGGSGLGHAMLPDPGPLNDQRHAVDQIIALAKAYAGALVLVATGPLTNVALALMREPAVASQLRRLVLMGGAYKGGGNSTPVAEFNIWHDPDAARIAFRSFSEEGTAPLVAVGLDVTRQTQLQPEQVTALADRIAGAPGAAALMRFLEDSTRYYFEGMERREGCRYMILHDPLAVAAGLDPSLIDTQAVAVDVETAGSLTIGMTVADWRGRWGRKPNAEVAVAVRADRMIAQFLDRMERLARTLT